jgi:hypothetical protein
MSIGFRHLLELSLGFYFRKPEIMSKKAFIKLALPILLFCCLAACSSVDKSTPEPRVFQEKPFSTDEWIKSDAYTRGEMARDLLRYETFQSLIGKNRGELLKVLGEPDIKTTGKCCYIRDDRGEVEVWLYKIESPDLGDGRKTKLNAIQIFFNRETKTVMALNRGAIDEKPAHFPMIG